ncbi:MAG: UvrD-helicase domain-containing protein [Methylococcales bacterium]
MISLTYAGAGGGKTTSLVDSVCEQIPHLNSNRFLCVITYTNDAERDIRKRLSDLADVPRNVFIGTIHSFLFRFIIKPHFDDGANFSIVSELAKKEEVIAGYIDWAKRTISDPDKRKNVINANWSKRKAEIYSKLINSQLMTYDQIVKISRELVSKSKIRNAVANKVQCLFVDEYQDTYKWQHDIFLKIYSCKKTDFFVVGDPNQSIYGFSYGASENNAVKPKKYEDFPICQVRSFCDSYNEKIINYRSSKEIVDVANLFNQSFQQKSYMGVFSPVVAIETPSHDEIYNIFHAKREELGLDGKVFYLSQYNDTLLPYIEKIEDDPVGRRCIRSVEACVSQLVGMSVIRLCESNSITRIQFRALSVLVGKQDSIDLPVVNKIFLNKFGRKLVCSQQKLGKAVPFEVNIKTGHRALTIHKSKGLEAESVLVILNSNKHINKLLKRKDLMKSEKDDDLRLGYVSFTRAKKLLVIACKEEVSPQNKIELKKLNIEVV